MSSKSQVLEAALQLTEEERRELIRELEVSVHGPMEEGVEEAWDEELRKRIESIDNGTAKLIPWENVKAEMRKMRGL